MTPLTQYRLDVANNGFEYDSKQEAAALELERVYLELINQTKDKGWFKKKVSSPKGLYLYGGVGCGKTYLMDLFFNTLPFAKKRRMHFYHLMRYVHEQLEHHKGKKNPLDIVAKTLSKDCRILCLDEFFVTDIGDAMILANLIKALFNYQVCLVCTSNIDPDNLYQNGLQRQQFIPAINLIKQHLVSHCLDSETDYRLRKLKNVNRYFEGDNADAMLSDIIQQLFNLRLKPATIIINKRDILIKSATNNALWIDFYNLCDGPRSTQDYIDIAHLYKTIAVSHVPQFHNTDDLARRFIGFVDECYDHRIMLFISSPVSLSDLYTKGRLNFEFERTQSRLIEMQSQEYPSQSR